jgi:hypothetical protein
VHFSLSFADKATYQEGLLTQGLEENCFCEEEWSFENVLGEEEIGLLEQVQMPIKAIVLVPSEDQIDTSAYAQIEGVQIQLDSPVCVEQLTNALSLYLEEPFSEEILCEI